MILDYSEISWLLSRWEKKLIKLMVRTFHTSRTFSAQDTCKKAHDSVCSPPLGIQRTLGAANIKTATLPFTVQRIFQFQCGSLADRAIDTPCLVRKGYSLLLSLLDFNITFGLEASWPAPHWTGTVCWSSGDHALPADKNWFSLGLAIDTQ